MSASSLFVEGGPSKIDTRFLTPLNGDIDANGFAISALAAVSATQVRCEQLSLPAGSLATAIAVQNPLQANLSRSGIATITPTNDNVLVAFPGITNSSVVLATLHCDSGVAIDATATAVSAVVAGTDSFRIYANAAATGSQEVAWFVAKL